MLAKLFWKLIGLGAVLSLNCSCSSLKYLTQAARGQMALSTYARPLEDVMSDEKTPPYVRALLSQIRPIKTFGESRGLKATKNYQTYVKLNRSAAVFVVSGCEPLVFKSLEWHFPLIGRVPYLGWFDSDEAHRFAAELEKQGLDVSLRGADAYSTLGWFRDPVLSTMLSRREESLPDLVDVILHESVHATFYIKNQTFFNESAARFIANRMTEEFLDERYGPHSKEKSAYLERERRAEEIKARFHRAYLALNDVYESKLSDPLKLEKKELILSNLRVELHLRGPLNNAVLMQYRTYYTGDDEFYRLHRACGLNWKSLMSLLQLLKPEHFPKPQAERFDGVIDFLIKKVVQTSNQALT